jgi:hypothetical protein
LTANVASRWTEITKIKCILFWRKIEKTTYLLRYFLVLFCVYVSTVLYESKWAGEINMCEIHTKRPCVWFSNDGCNIGPMSPACTSTHRSVCAWICFRKNFSSYQLDLCVFFLAHIYYDIISLSWDFIEKTNKIIVCHNCRLVFSSLSLTFLSFPIISRPVY